MLCCVMLAGLRLLDCPGLVFPYAFVAPPTPLAPAVVAVSEHSSDSDSDSDAPPKAAAMRPAAAPAVKAEIYTGVDSVDRQRAMQECCAVVPLSQVHGSLKLLHST